MVQFSLSIWEARMFNLRFVIVILCALISSGLCQATDTQAFFECPELDGQFEDRYQCDKYWECLDGIATPKLCDDGFVFDPLKRNAADPCDSPFLVDCKERKELQPPTYPTPNCLRRNGFFGDPQFCGVFYTCLKGVEKSRIACGPGLHYDESAGICTWPAQAKRTSCIEERQSINGFTCPDGDTFDNQGQKIPHPAFINKENCQKFYICLSGIVPQEASCSLGQVFNDKSNACDYPENVPRCHGWYKDHPDFRDYYYYYDEVAPASDPGKQDTIV